MTTIDTPARTATAGAALPDAVEEVTIDGGTLMFEGTPDMVATGLLVPFGVEARSNLGLFAADEESFTFPEDTTGMVHNANHRREDVLGAITGLFSRPGVGIFATYRYADTPEGRKAYAEGKNGAKRYLSAEVRDVLIKGRRAIGGHIFGSAQVEAPAFRGATLLAAEDTTILPADLDGSELLDKRGFDATVEEGGTLELHTDNLPATIEVEPAEGDTVTYTPTDTDSTPTTTEGITVNASAPTLEAGTTPAPIPGTLLAGLNPTAIETPAEAAEGMAYELGTIFAAMNTLRQPAGALEEDHARASTLLAALSDIKVNTTGGLTTATGGVIQPAWVGKMWQGRTYARKYIDLVTHLFGGINIAGRKGFKIDQGTALVQHWGGNKSDVPSGTASTSTAGSTRRGYGYAADIAREFFDLEGGAEVIEAFIRGVVDSYAKITDLDAVADILGIASGTVSAAGVITADGTKIEPAGTYPDVAGHDYPVAMGMVIDAIDAVTDADDDPAFVLVNRAAWRQLRFTPKDLVPEYVTFAVKGDGTGNADSVILKRAPEDAWDDAGFDNLQPAVVAGSKAGLEFREQGETPIRLDALDIAKGGIDKAVIGYLETFPVRAESFVSFGTAKA